MEYLITILPITFCMLSGILIAWGIQVAACLFNIIFIVTKARAHPRSLEVLQFSVVIMTTAALFVLLFYATSFAAVHMLSIVLAETWYAMFLFFITSSSFSDEMTVRDKFGDNTLIYHK